MKQLVLNLRNGATSLQEIPAPAMQEGHVLIQTACTVVSAGTEKMLVDFGKGNWLQKARQQPARVQEVLTKIKTDGLQPTLKAIQNKLDQWLPLGYANAGTVLAVGKNITHIKPGDRVASNGPHAGIVSVPANLTALIPDNVSDEAAAFTTLGAIALQSIRLVQPTFGETVVVIGLGLLGQLTIQLLKASGCRVIGIDTNEYRTGIAAGFGVEVYSGDAVRSVQAATNYTGADAVIIAAATKDEMLISSAANMCRKRARIVLSGVAPLHINRADFYEKELSFQVSCSYGPGRYDYQYEQKGADYPLPYVRWTEQRNMEAVLRAMSTGTLNVQPLIGTILPVEMHETAYHEAPVNGIATLFRFKESAISNKTTIYVATPNTSANTIGIIGAGNFVRSVLLPELEKSGADIGFIASQSGLSATALAQKFGIAQAGTDYREAITNNDIRAVIIASRHSQHAAMVVEALQESKHVFVEKPLCINREELSQIVAAYRISNGSLTVGYNRRYAPMAVKMKSLTGDDPMMNIVITVNAGTIDPKSWLHDTSEGGRIIGEVCHFIDLATYLSGAPVSHVCMNGNSINEGAMMLRFTNGSSATIHYFTNGHKRYSKERVEIYTGGRTLVLDNWRRLEGYGFSGFSNMNVAQDKGHSNEIHQWLQYIKAPGEALISIDSILNTSLATFAALESISGNNWQPVS